MLSLTMSPSTNRSSMEAQNGSAYSTSQLDFPAKISHSGGFRNQPFISSRTATTTSTATTTTKISLTTVHPCQWKQPELSIGSPCQSMDVLGRYKCWSLKDNSPAHIIWKTLSNAIIALLQGLMEHLASRDSDLMVEMFMIGRKAKSSSPTVLFSCESKPCRQQALELLKRKSILASYPGVLAAECSRLPRLLALGEVMEMPILPSGVYVNGPLRSCGINVLISTGPHRPPRKATVGGIVCIDNDYYGLTCIHAFSEVKTPDAGEDRDLEFAFYGLNDDHGLGDSDDEDDSVGMTSQGSISSRSSQSLTTNEVVNLQASLQKLDQSFAERDRDLSSGASAEGKRQVTEPTLLGTFFAGPPKSSLDWALVKIEHWGFLLPFSTASLDPEVDITVDKIISGDRVVYPKHIARATADARVLICTGSTGTAYEGSLSTVASFTKAAGTEKFQELWSVRRLDGSFVDGDCGSWVVDFESGVLYGHIVSGYPGTRSAYVVPAVQIFYDMKKYLGKTVQLSTAERKASLLLSNRLEANHISEAAGMGIDATVSLAMNQPAKDSRPPERCLPSSSCLAGSSAMIRAEGDVNANVSDNTISNPISSLAPFTRSAFTPSQSLIENPGFPQEAFIIGDNGQGYGNGDFPDIQSSAHSLSLFRPDSPDEEISAHVTPFGGWLLINNADSDIQAAANTAASTSQHQHTAALDRASSFTPQHAMNPPVFSQSGQALRPSNGTQQAYQSLSMTTMNAFASEGGASTPQAPTGSFTSGPCSVLIRRLPTNTTEDNLRLMVVWSEDFIDAEVLSPEKSEDPGFHSAILRFKSHPGALEAKNMLDGKPNVANNAQMIVEIFYDIPTTPRRYTLDNTSKPSPSSSTSSTALSVGLTPRQSSRFNGSFQSPQRVSPTTNGTYTSNELPIPEVSAHYQTLFSPQSPIGNHLNDRTRITGNSLIINDSVDDDDTGELLKDPVGYTENGPSVQARRPTNPQFPISWMAGLSLNINSAAGPASPNSFATPTSLTSMLHANPMSPMTLTNNEPPVNYQLGSQHYQRHNFPPVNPADQNPPCNTLYVGNLPIDTSEDELKAMFSKQRGYKRLCFRTKQNGHMCFVEFEDVSFATKALYELYGHPLHNSTKGGIRLSFSKNPLGVRSGQGMSSPEPQNVPGVMQGMNGVMLGGAASTLSTASGPPPGLALPLTIGPNTMGYSGGYSGARSRMTASASQYAASSFTGNSNGWNGPAFAGATAAGGPVSMLNGGPSGPRSTATK